MSVPKNLQMLGFLAWGKVGVDLGEGEHPREEKLSDVNVAR